MFDVCKKFENLSLQQNPIFLEAARLNVTFFTWRLFTAQQMDGGKDEALFLATSAVIKMYNSDTHARYMKIVFVLFDLHNANPNRIFGQQKTTALIAKQTGVLIEFLHKLQKQQQHIRQKWLSL